MIITSNRTREIHDALKRRCLYHWVDYPSAERELAIVKSRVPGISAKLSQQVVRSCRRCAARISSSRRAWPRRIDWATAFTELDARALTPQVVGDTLGALLEISGRHRAHAGREAAEGLKDATSERLSRCVRIPGGRQMPTADRSTQSAHGQYRRQHRRLRPRVACGRAAGRAGLGHRRHEALQAIDIGNRADVFTTLEAIFVKRHEHALIFAQAFELFFRAARTGSTCSDRCRCRITP